MGRPKRGPLPSEINETLATIEAWRRTRKPGVGMPEALWLEAADWARREGISPTCKALGLSFTDLKKHMGIRHDLRHVPSLLKPTFVALGQACLQGEVQTGAVLEVTGRDGERMVLRFAPGSVVDAPGLLATFMGRRA